MTHKLTHKHISSDLSPPGMAADVGTFLRKMKGYKEEEATICSSLCGGKSKDTITRDLLGGGNCSSLESTELDLDLEVPKGWEKRLDMKSGKVYLKKSGSQNKQKPKEPFQKLQDLNFPPSSRHATNFFDESSLDLKLFSSSPPNYQSVCTLDKVKSALERAEREMSKKRSVSFSKSSSPVLSNSSSSVREMVMEAEYDEKMPSSFAVACSTCFHYVLVPRDNPKCPRCQGIVTCPVAVKKPRIDLNISI